MAAARAEGTRDEGQSTHRQSAGDDCDLAEMKARNRTASPEIDFSATTRKTKQLITLEGVSYGIGSRTLFKDIHFSVTSGIRVGLVGPNGSGKTTLLRLLRGEIKPESGRFAGRGIANRLLRPEPRA